MRMEPLCCSPTIGWQGNRLPHFQLQAAFPVHCDHHAFRSCLLAVFVLDHPGEKLRYACVKTFCELVYCIVTTSSVPRSHIFTQYHLYQTSKHIADNQICFDHKRPEILTATKRNYL